MKRRRALIGLAAACAAELTAQRSDLSSVNAVQAAIRDYYTIFQSGDVNRYRTLVTADYLLLEHGERITLEDDIKMMPKQGSQRTDTFDFRATEIVGDVAYAHWFLESRISDETGTRERRWLESGVLRRSQGAWKFALLHSTRIDNR